MDSKLYDQGNVNSIKMRYNPVVLLGVMQQLSNGGAADYTQRDAVVEVVMHCFTYASPAAVCLDVYRVELQLRWSNDARAVRKGTLTLNVDSHRSLENGIEEAHCAECQHDQEATQCKRKKNGLRAIQKVERKLGYETIGVYPIQTQDRWLAAVPIGHGRRAYKWGPIAIARPARSTR